MAEMIRPDLQLEAVRRTPLRCSHHTGVIDQHAELALPSVGEPAYRGEVGKIELANLTITRNGVRGGLALSHIAYGKYHMRALFGERSGCGEADAAVGAGNEKSTSRL